MAFYFEKEKIWKLSWTGVGLYLTLSFGDEHSPRYALLLSTREKPWFLRWKIKNAEQLILAMLKADIEIEKRVEAEFAFIDNLFKNPPTQKPKLTLIKGKK